MKKRIVIVLLICFIAPSVIPISLQSRQNINFTTHCWSSGAGTGDGGFYKCNKNGCDWVDDEDPLGEADQECDQPD